MSELSSALLSVVIPSRPGELGLAPLVESLHQALSAWDYPYEILVSFPKAESESLSPHPRLRVLREGQLGRAAQMNRAASHSQGSWLWFVHADSVLNPEVFEFLSRVVLGPKEPQILYYFLLRFDAGAPAACHFNAKMANFRSQRLGRPFGDQGFLLSRQSFAAAGGFPESFDSGEDHAFVQKFLETGGHLQSCPAYIQTSSRKYRERGWLSTTLRHLGLTIKQEISRKGVSL